MNKAALFKNGDTLTFAFGLHCIPLHPTETILFAKWYGIPQHASHKELHVHSVFFLMCINLGDSLVSNLHHQQWCMHNKRIVQPTHPATELTSLRRTLEGAAQGGRGRAGLSMG